MSSKECKSPPGHFGVQSIGGDPTDRLQVIGEGRWHVLERTGNSEALSVPDESLHEIEGGVTRHLLTCDIVVVVPSPEQ